MNIAFDFTKEDIWNYGKHITFNIPKFRRRFIINVLMAPLFVCAIGFTMNFNLILYISCSIGFTAFYIYVLNMVLKGKIIKLKTSEEGSIGEHIIEIDTYGIKEKLSTREEKHAWSEITKIVQDKKYFYFHWGEVSAHTIPKRIFRKENEEINFFTTAMDYYNAGNV